MSKKEQNKKINRILIFCFYNNEGIVEDYVIDLLSQMVHLVSRIIFVVNGSINNEGFSKVQKHTDEIICRENIGRDYGAYREIITRYLMKDELKKYDELLLCNDTFYGFFRPLEDILSEMENNPASLVGLNRVDRGILDLIQSYFLLIKKELLLSGLVEKYFLENNSDGKSYGCCVALLETKLKIAIENAGYACGSICNTDLYDIYANPLLNIKKYGMPILKRKSFNRDFCDTNKLNEALEYIEEKNGAMHLPHIDDGTKECKMPVGKRRLIRSCVSVEQIIRWGEKGPFYIFGAGNIADELYYTYFEEENNFMGFVVSSLKNEHEKNAISLNTIPINSRIIIGVKQELQSEINKLLPETMDKLLLWKVEN